MTKRIGVRELRQNASVWLRQVQQGDSFEITDRGRLIALLIPAPPPDPIERLRASARVSAVEGDLLDLGDPLPARSDIPGPSEILEQMRAAER
jgi:prevent-host-death family protein